MAVSLAMTWAPYLYTTRKAGETIAALSSLISPENTPLTTPRTLDRRRAAGLQAHWRTQLFGFGSFVLVRLVDGGLYRGKKRVAGRRSMDIA